MKGCTMKFSFTTSFAILILVVTAAIAQTQTTDSEAVTINSLRSNIQRMIGNPPARGASEEPDYRRQLQSLRSRLRDALIERRGGLKARIQNLRAPGALPEVLAHAQLLEKELTQLNVEVGGLDRDPGQAISSPAAPSAPAQDPELVALRAEVEKLKELQKKESEARLKSEEAAPEAVKKAVDEAADEAAKKEKQEKTDAVVAEAKAITGKQLADATVPAVASDKPPFVPCSATGQVTPTGSEPPTRYDEILCNFAGNINKTGRVGPRHITLNQDENYVFVLLLSKLTKTIEDKSFSSFITAAQEQRVDQQVGAGPSSSGTTSLVTKGGVPYLLGLATENGAATQSQSGTTITFRANPAGVINAFARKGFITGYREDDNDPFMKFLRKTSLGFTFDTSRGAQPGVFTGDKQQLSAFSARFEFVNERNPLLAKYQRDWERLNATAGIDLANQTWKSTKAMITFEVAPGQDWVFSDPALQAWLDQTNQRLGAIPNAMELTPRANAIAKVLEEQYDVLPVKLLKPETVTSVTEFGTKLLEFQSERQKLLDKIAKGKIFTLEYTNNRGVNAPDTSNVNFIAATGTGSRIDLTANGSFTFFNKLPVASITTPTAGRVRDFQFAGQLTKPFTIGDGQFDFWFSGRYERLLADASTQAGTTMPATKGDIAVGQLGINIPIKSLGIKFPISVTFANRTELIKEKEVRGNIGFTMNWDTLFSKLKPF
jgi:hypothetical protein